MRVSLKFFQSLLWTQSQGYSWAWLVPSGGRAMLALGLGAENGPSCLLCVDSVLPVGGAISWFPPHAKVGVTIPQAELGVRHRGPHVR